MHPTTYLPLLTLLTLPTTAQIDKTAYCLRGKAPNPPDCRNIIDNGVNPAVAYTRPIWMYGNCRVRVDNGILNDGAISGEDLKEALNNIMSHCDLGFEYVGGVRVEIELCVVGQQGGVECNSPLYQVQKRGEGDGGWGGRDGVLGRRHLTDVRDTSLNPDFVLPRQTPVEGLTCGGTVGAAQIDSCNAIADELMAGTPDVFDIPLIMNGDGCQLHVYPLDRSDMTGIRKHIGVSIKEGNEICKDGSGKYVGFVSNYFDFMPFHFFWGQFCGRFGTGYPGACTPGGRV
jgi:hypothetical protein